MKPFQIIEDRVDKVRSALIKNKISDLYDPGIYELRPKKATYSESLYVDATIKFKTNMGEFRLKIQETYDYIRPDYFLVGYAYHLVSVDDERWLEIFNFEQEASGPENRNNEWKARAHLHCKCANQEAYKRVHIPLYISKPQDNQFFLVHLAGTEAKEDLLINIIRWIAADFIHACNN